MSEFIVLNDEDFELYKNTCLKLINVFGLNNWNVDFLFSIDNIKPNDQAQMQNIFKGNIATFRLNKKQDSEFWNKKNKINNIKHCAMHEVLELLLANIQDLAEDRTWDELVFEKEIHSLINRIENLFGDYLFEKINL